MRNIPKTIHTKMFRKTLMILFAGAMLIGCFPAIDLYRQEVADIPKEEGVSVSDPNPMTMTAQEYYERLGEVISVVDAEMAETVHTERQALMLFEERGFIQYSVTTDFNINGDVLEEKNISEQSNEKHPIYTTFFQAENGDFWTVIDLNGRLFANPLSYNSDMDGSFKVIVSETNSIISYDGIGNQYFETIPGQSVLQVKVVNRIDAETLNMLGKEVLGRK